MRDIKQEICIKLTRVLKLLKVFSASSVRHRVINCCAEPIETGVPQMTYLSTLQNFLIRFHFTFIL